MPLKITEERICLTTNFYQATLLATIATKKYLMLPDVMENRCCYRRQDRYGKAKPELLAALKGSDLEITDFIWYGGDSNYENIEMLKAMPEVQNADVVFGVGGGRAVDTVKTLCDRIDKPFFTFPTLASNCASCTAISVIYNADGTFKEYAYLKAPALHTFINTKIIAESPEKLFWAGIGDALSKEYEVVFACRDKDMTHTPLLGRVLAEACTEPLVSYGKKHLRIAEITFLQRISSR